MEASFPSDIICWGFKFSLLVCWVSVSGQCVDDNRIYNNTYIVSRVWSARYYSVKPIFGFAIVPTFVEHAYRCLRFIPHLVNNVLFHLMSPGIVSRIYHISVNVVQVRYLLQWWFCDVKSIVRLDSRTAETITLAWLACRADRYIVPLILVMHTMQILIRNTI
jgi:hypothetical protein